LQPHKNTVNYSSFPRKPESRTSVGAVTPGLPLSSLFEEISRRSSTRHPGAGRGPSRRSMDPVIVRARHCSCLRSPECRSMGPDRLRGCNPIGIDEHGHDFDMSLSRCPGESRDPCLHKSLSLNVFCDRAPRESPRRLRYGSRPAPGRRDMQRRAMNANWITASFAGKKRRGRRTDRMYECQINWRLGSLGRLDQVGELGLQQVRLVSRDRIGPV
jgi:hypothetical protein